MEDGLRKTVGNHEGTAEWQDEKPVYENVRRQKEVMRHENARGTIKKM